MCCEPTAKFIRIFSQARSGYRHQYRRGAQTRAYLLFNYLNVRTKRYKKGLTCFKAKSTERRAFPAEVGEGQALKGRKTSQWGRVASLKLLGEKENGRFTQRTRTKFLEASPRTSPSSLHSSHTESTLEPSRLSLGEPGGSGLAQICRPWSDSARSSSTYWRVTCDGRPADDL